MLQRLDKLLVHKGLVSSREAAKELIMQGCVSVSGFVQQKPASMVSSDALLEIRPLHGDTDCASWVSRGAHKLLKGLDTWRIDPAGWRCVDIGASTGGFTQVLLSRGAAQVAAVDVGYGQLAWILRNDPRVLVMERTNARYLTPDDIGWPADLVTTDASFISLRLLLSILEKLLSSDGKMLVLVKPQFEVGRDKVGKGVVKDPALHMDVLRNLDAFIGAETGLFLEGATFSPIRGPEGNIEFIFLLGRADTRGEPVDFAALVAEAHENI